MTIKMDILLTIREENVKLGNKVVILTYGIGDGRHSEPPDTCQV